MASRRSSSRWAFVALGVALVLFVAYLYLFRTIRREDPANLLTLHYRWGSLQKVGFDLNKDGIVELVASYAGWATDRSAHDPIANAVASSYCDGVFDVAIEYSDEGRPLSITFDADRDGIAEIYEAAEGYQRMAARCQAWSRSIPDSSDLGSF